VSHPQVTLYGRPGCHLCEDALAVIERVRARRAFELTQRNIEDDERLHRAYLERIPVVCIDGREAFELFVDETAFEAALIKPRPAPTPYVE
jgi:glutaredoxin